jgi:hypothetical protein
MQWYSSNFILLHPRQIVCMHYKFMVLYYQVRYPFCPYREKEILEGNGLYSSQIDLYKLMITFFDIIIC